MRNWTLLFWASLRRNHSMSHSIILQSSTWTHSSHANTRRAHKAPGAHSQALIRLAGHTRGCLGVSRFTRSAREHEITPLLTINGVALFFISLCRGKSNIWGCCSCKVSREAGICQRLTSEISQSVTKNSECGHFVLLFPTRVKQLWLLNRPLIYVPFQCGNLW